MTRNLIIGSTLVASIVLSGCAGMSTTEQRTLSGAGIGTAAGVVIGAATGEWAWAAGGAAIGAATGYVYDQEQKKQAAARQQAYNEGVQSGKQQAQKN
jgi:osmotically inducible lipoprotein OsmB